MTLNPDQQRLLLDLARSVVTSALAGRPLPEAPIDDPALHAPAGCFVSLHEQGTHRLRGCVGRIQSSDPLLATVREVAQSVLRDPRFANDPIRPEHLAGLTIEISILSPPLPALHALDFDPLNDGIVVTYGGRTGTFLPQVARETGWTRQQLLSRLCTEKLGIAAEAWRDPKLRLSKYRVTLIGPEPFVPPDSPGPSQ